MSVVEQWVLHNLGAVLASCAAICLGLAGLLIFSIYRGRTPEHDHDVAPRDVADTIQRLKLHCGDVKALANLAVQRHMDNTTFLRHLRVQPSYRELLQYFNIELRRELTSETADPPSKSVLAVACLNEIERLERELLEFPGTPRLLDSSTETGRNLRG